MRSKEKERRGEERRGEERKEEEWNGMERRTESSRFKRRFLRRQCSHRLRILRSSSKMARWSRGLKKARERGMQFPAKLRNVGIGRERGKWRDEGGFQFARFVKRKIGDHEIKIVWFLIDEPRYVMELNRKRRDRTTIFSNEIIKITKLRSTESVDDDQVERNERDEGPKGVRSPALKRKRFFPSLNPSLYLTFLIPQASIPAAPLRSYSDSQRSQVTVQRESMRIPNGPVLEFHCRATLLFAMTPQSQYSRRFTDVSNYASDGVQRLAQLSVTEVNAT
uniref:Uncharacterized protein n=1 Tax=Vespula pensylvanica TaxID=30213 RepID=A0A834PGH0_VESPE|nr:hypothetical protein H0235_001603 [Vespula pensylvanica]